MRKKRYMIVLSALLVVTVLLAAGCGSKESADGSESGGAEGFGDFEAELYGGGVVSEEIFSEAELTLVSVWATYCGFCIEEMPNFEKLSKEYGDRGFQAVGIVTDAAGPEDEAVQAIIDETGVTYRQILFNEQMYETAMRDVQAVPTSLLVDRDGNVVETFVGMQSYETWEKAIEERL